MQNIIRLETRLGRIDIELDGDRAPETSGHFSTLVRHGTMDGTHFYRVVHTAKDRVVQSTIDVVQGGIGWKRAEAVANIAHETTLVTGLRHVDGAVSLGRWGELGGNSEFFVCVGDQPSLDATAPDTGKNGGFAVFGKVIEGMDVVRKIHALPCGGIAPRGYEKFQGEFLKDVIMADINLV